MISAAPCETGGSGVEATQVKMMEREILGFYVLLVSASLGISVISV